MQKLDLRTMWELLLIASLNVTNILMECIWFIVKVKYILSFLVTQNFRFVNKKSSYISFRQENAAKL